MVSHGPEGMTVSVDTDGAIVLRIPKPNKALRVSKTGESLLFATTGGLLHLGEKGVKEYPLHALSVNLIVQMKEIERLEKYAKLMGKEVSLPFDMSDIKL